MPSSGSGNRPCASAAAHRKSWHKSGTPARFGVRIAIDSIALQEKLLRWLSRNGLKFQELAASVHYIVDPRRSSRMIFRFTDRRIFITLDPG
jgi:hypothetical protein